MEWKYSKGQVEDAAIAETENHFNITFPAFYKSIVKQYNGARPRPHRAYTLKGRVVNINSFLPIGREYPEDILSVNERLRSKLPKNLIAFANDSFGNYFCFDNRHDGGIREEIIFWEHEKPKMYKIKKINLL